MLRVLSSAVIVIALLTPAAGASPLDAEAFFETMADYGE